MARNRLLFDATGKVETPTLVLSTVGGKLLGQIPFIDEDSVEVLDNFNDASEISFDVYKIVDGQMNPMWDALKNFKLLWYKEHNSVYVIQVDINDSDGLCKHISGKSAGEVELGQIKLRDIEINTEDDIDRDDYKVATLYNTEDTGASILHRVLDKAPHYSVSHVDYTVADIQRSFSFNDTSIKDALDDIAEEIGCIFVYDVCFEGGTLIRNIAVYDLEYYCMDCGERFDHGSVCPECGGVNIRDPYGTDTGIVIDKDSLASEVSLETDVDSVKNCFALEAGDDLMTAAVRMCMPSSDGYLWYLNSDTMEDMSSALCDKVESYNSTYTEYNSTKQYDISDDNYQKIVTKYHNDEYADVTYSATAIGFPAVIDAYYEAITLSYYVKTSMMPTIEMSETTAATSIESIRTNLTSVAVQNLSASTSSATVASVIKNMSKLYFIQSQFEIDVVTTSWSYESRQWVGSITLTSKIDDGDDDTDPDSATGIFTLSVSGDYEKYIKQQIQKKLDDAESEDSGVVSLFNKTGADFSNELTEYSYDCLDEFWQVCQTCIDALIEAGWGGVTSASETAYAYYTEMRNKLYRIEAERDLRQQEIDVIASYEEAISNIIDDVHTALNMKTFLGDSYTEFAAYRREDTYSNDNYISDGLSDSQLIAQAQLFIKAAEHEIYKSANLQHTISATVHNLMMMPEFKSLLDNFQVGNWIHIIVDGVAYKLRLLSYTVNFGSIQNIDVEFSDMSVAGTGIADLTSIIAQASSMATSYGAITRQAEKSTAANSEFNTMFAQGLDLTNTKLVSNADHQEMVVDSHGITMKKYDPVIDDYYNEQMKITNTTIAYTDDDWETVQTAFGKYYSSDGTAMYGVIGDNIVGKIIAGGNLSISSYSEDGDRLFFVDGDGVTLKNSSMQVECDNGAEIVIDPVNGFAIGTAPLINDGVLNTDNAKLWVDTDGNVKITLSNGDDLEDAVNKSDIVSYKTYYQVCASNTEFPTESVIDASDGTYVRGTDALSWDMSDADLYTGDVVSFHIDNLSSAAYTSFIYGYKYDEDSFDSSTSTTITELSDAYSKVITNVPNGTIKWSMTGADATYDTDTTVSVHIVHNGPTKNWYDQIPNTPDGNYLWVATYVTRLDGTGMWTTPYCITDESLREKIDGIDTKYANYILGDDGIDAKITSISNVLEYGYTDSDGVSHDGLTSQVSQVKSELELKATSSDVTLQVSEAKTDVLNSVDHVTTVTGFTFDMYGLTITNSNVDVSTNVNADGMVIASNTGDTLLTVNSSGVEAINLNSSKYLIVGGRSRFENFGTSYTGCFWIG